MIAGLRAWRRSRAGGPRVGDDRRADGRGGLPRYRQQRAPEHFARRDTINVQKLIGATDGFILRPFLYGGALLGFSGAFLSLILSEILVMRLSSAVTEVAQVFGTKFDLNGLSFDECLLLLLVCSMIGWIAAWLATVQHLRHFTPD